MPDFSDRNIYRPRHWLAVVGGLCMAGYTGIGAIILLLLPENSSDIYIWAGLLGVMGFGAAASLATYGVQWVVTIVLHIVEASRGG